MDGYTHLMVLWKERGALVVRVPQTFIENREGRCIRSLIQAMHNACKPSDADPEP